MEGSVRGLLRTVAVAECDWKVSWAYTQVRHCLRIIWACGSVFDISTLINSISNELNKPIISYICATNTIICIVYNVSEYSMTYDDIN